ERTFDLDLVNNDTNAPGPDGQIDSSGTHYYSPQYLLATRDNLRQSVADLFVLNASLDTAAGVSLNTAKKTLIGHSLGGTTATVFLAFEDSITATTLGMPAAGLTRLLINSPSFGPALLAGLSAAGLEQGTAEFEQLVTAIQTAIESGDAINFGAAAAANSPIHMIEVVGDGADVLPDQTVPNSVATAPLSGSNPLARALGFDPANPTSVSSSGSALIQFIAGDHGSLVSPAASLAATVEMQTQMATFSATGGASLPITDTSVIRGAATGGN
ncbi:MAG: lipase, partial [Gammaproteobacteria bacterium]|nr:lipase [Gammaproteobacteria bacterium]